MLLPMTLPTAMSRSPRRPAINEAATSGREVPAATTVSPMTRSESPAQRARAVAPVTMYRAPRRSTPRPTITSAAWVTQWLRQPQDPTGLGATVVCPDRIAAPTNHTR